jgi:FG-GAP repeat
LARQTKAFPSLSGDGSAAIVGGDFDNDETGAAWVFTRSGGVWSQQGSKLVGTGAVGSALQGISVSLSNDGNTAIVGGSGDNNSVGAAWVFARAGGAWSQQGQKLVGTGVADPFGAQGYSVSLSGDGNTAVIGAPFDNGGVGAAWVFTRSGGVWSQSSKMVGTGAVGPFTVQGYSVSLSKDGNAVVVGGPGDNGEVGAAWVFAQPVFAGTPGKSNCHGQSVSALARQYKGLNAAAAALGYADVSALQGAIMAFCGE